MMTRTQRDQWVSALRSGNYPQCQQVLVEGNEASPSYCCLGVLGVTVLGYQPRQLNDTFEGAVDFRAGEAYAKVLPLTGWEASTFYRMNDQEGKSFDEIADWIEKHVEVDG
jgi:hypothetical protein